MVQHLELSKYVSRYVEKNCKCSQKKYHGLAPIIPGMLKFWKALRVISLLVHFSTLLIYIDENWKLQYKLQFLLTFMVVGWLLYFMFEIFSDIQEKRMKDFRINFSFKISSPSSFFTKYFTLTECDDLAHLAV